MHVVKSRDLKLNEVKIRWDFSVKQCIVIVKCIFCLFLSQSDDGPFTVPQQPAKSHIRTSSPAFQKPTPKAKKAILENVCTCDTQQDCCRFNFLTFQRKENLFFEKVIVLCHFNVSIVKHGDLLKKIFFLLIVFHLPNAGFQKQAYMYLQQMTYVSNISRFPK